jgi:hypothetical protein
VAHNGEQERDDGCKGSGEQLYTQRAGTRLKSHPAWGVPYEAAALFSLMHYGNACMVFEEEQLKASYTLYGWSSHLHGPYMTGVTIKPNLALARHKARDANLQCLSCSFRV